MVIYFEDDMFSTTCMLTHTHTHTHAYARTHTDTHTHTHTHMHVYRMNSEVVELPFSDAIVANRETHHSQQMEPVRSESK